jgi:hypothetical protein
VLPPPGVERITNLQRLRERIDYSTIRRVDRMKRLNREWYTARSRGVGEYADAIDHL